MARHPYRRWMPALLTAVLAMGLVTATALPTVAATPATAAYREDRPAQGDPVGTVDDVDDALPGDETCVLWAGDRCLAYAPVPDLPLVPEPTVSEPSWPPEPPDEGLCLDGVGDHEQCFVHVPVPDPSEVPEVPPPSVPEVPDPGEPPGVPEPPEVPELPTQPAPPKVPDPGALPEPPAPPAPAAPADPGDVPDPAAAAVGLVHDVWHAAGGPECRGPDRGELTWFVTVWPGCQVHRLCDGLHAERCGH